MVFAGWFGVITALTAFYIAFAELFNDTLKKNVLPLGELSFLTRALGSQTAAPYDVNRTDPRGYGPTGAAQRNVRVSSVFVPSPYLLAFQCYRHMQSTLTTMTPRSRACRYVNLRMTVLLSLKSLKIWENLSDVTLFS